MHLHRESTRLDVVDGLQCMCKVTGRFTCGSKDNLHACQDNIDELVQKVVYMHKEKRRGVEVQWPTLKEVLAADPRATTTYSKIVEWICSRCAADL